MKIFVLATLLLSLADGVLAQPADREPGYLMQGVVSIVAFPLNKDDKFQHVAVGSAISAFVAYETDSAWKGCLAALALGVAKEAYDEWSGTGHFEGRDVAYTVAGCAFTIRF